MGWSTHQHNARGALCNLRGREGEAWHAGVGAGEGLSCLRACVARSCRSGVRRVASVVRRSRMQVRRAGRAGCVRAGTPAAWQGVRPQQAGVGSGAAGDQRRARGVRGHDAAGSSGAGGVAGGQRGRAGRGWRGRDRGTGWGGGTGRSWSRGRCGGGRANGCAATTIGCAANSGCWARWGRCSWHSWGAENRGCTLCAAHSGNAVRDCARNPKPEDQGSQEAKRSAHAVRVLRMIECSSYANGSAVWYHRWGWTIRPCMRPVLCDACGGGGGRGRGGTDDGYLLMHEQGPPGLGSCGAAWRLKAPVGSRR
jgi:hypothetical protein